MPIEVFDLVEIRTQRKTPQRDLQHAALSRLDALL